jgi:hypothetical protein
MAEIEVYVSAAPVRVEVGGAQGTPAVALLMKPPVANVAALPASGNSTNDGRVTTDTGNAYRWTGSDWILVGPFQGETGAAATIVAATAETGEPGTEVAVVMGGTSTARTFQFTIPKGDLGPNNPDVPATPTPPANPRDGQPWRESGTFILSFWDAEEGAWFVSATNSIPANALTFNGDILTFNGETLTFAA